MNIVLSIPEGIPADILPLTWPSGTAPHELSDFESQARHLRYRALGQACLDHNYAVLLLAHHEDDLAETTLMRLAGGSRGKGLSPIQEISKIPECHGLRGIGSSSPIDPVHLETRTTESSPKHNSGLDVSSVFEKSGIVLLRPLLTYSKDQLRAFCLANDTSWVEDRSNQDLSLTPRNTIRSLLDGERLPQALRKRSLLSLAQITQESELRKQRKAQELFAKCKIRRFDIRASSIVIRIPKNAIHTLPNSSYFSRQFLRDVAGYFLQTLIRPITPDVRVHRNDLQLLITRFFPELKSTGDDELKHSHKGNSAEFTTRGVMFRRLPHSTENFPNHLWALSRQRPSWPDFVYIPSKSSRSKMPELPGALPSTWSPWHFYDGRYWIRIRNLSPFPLILRTLMSTDVTYLRQTLPKQELERITKLIGMAAPGKIRFTLPVIVQSTSDQHDRPASVSATDHIEEFYRAGHTILSNTFSRERIIGFPSFGPELGWIDSTFSPSTSSSSQAPRMSSQLGLHPSPERKDIGWEIRYKDVPPKWMEWIQTSGDKKFYSWETKEEALFENKRKHSNVLVPDGERVKVGQGQW